MQGIRLDVRAVIDTATTFLEQHQQVEILGYAINLMGLEEQLSGNIQELISPFVMRTASLVASSASAILWIGFVFFGSFYMVRDTDKIDRYVHSLVPPRYKDEIESLFQETIEVWNEYFRGKIILGGVVGIITFIMLEAVGVRSSLLFGLLAGILEFIPTIGPVAASLPAILLALFQGSTRLPISNIGFAILVIALYLFLHQIVKGNVLVPHIIGHSVNLNPLVVLVGVMLGASVAGILGLFFAAPVIATLRIWVGYVYGKLLDHEAEPPAAETD
jgi:predicted PurR-regulated permease PerM